VGWLSRRGVRRRRRVPARLTQRQRVQILPHPLRVARRRHRLGRRDAILDGEIVALDAAGRAQFNRLLYRRAEPHFYAFDCMWLDGRDLRSLPLAERKTILRTLVPPQPARLLYVGHIDQCGVALFQEVCRQDLEGIVAKRRDGIYDPGAPTWVKIKNRGYSLAVDRRERFERMRAPH
jgi:ATP-dependent DNA ligase